MLEDLGAGIKVAHQEDAAGSPATSPSPLCLYSIKHFNEIILTQQPIAPT